MGRYLLVLLAFFSLQLGGDLAATHLAGGEIVYSHISGNTYQVRLTVYRDCDGINLPSQSSIQISPTNSGSVFSAPRVSITDITPTCPGQVSRCSGGSVPGIEQHIYVGNVTLNPLPIGQRYTLFWQSCCRNFAITTLNQPGNTGFYLSTTLDPNQLPRNNSPEFLNVPIAYLCAGSPATISPNANDPDGDALLYSFTSCLDQGPTNVSYAGGFSATNPLSTSGGFNLNANTGAISFTPTQAGQVGVICIKAEEFRNGIKIGEIVRDIQVRVLSCNNQAPVVSQVPNVVVPVGQQYCVNVTATDADNDNITLTATSGIIPPGTFTVTSSTPGSAAGTFCFTPTIANQGQTYTVTVQGRDDACPSPSTGSTTFNITVPIPCNATATATGTDASCAGANDGTATVTTQNTTPPLQYTWSNGSNSQSISGLAPGTYTVTVVDGRSCVANASVSIGGATSPVGVTATASGANCNQNNGSISATASGGSGIYTYTLNGGSAQSNGNYSNLAAGTYTIDVIDGNGCTATTTVTVGNAPDVTPPTLNCPADIQVFNDSLFCGAVVNFNATATDDCGGAVTISYSTAPGSFFQVGFTTVTVTATDNAGNTATCNFQVAVYDHDEPIITCPTSTVLSCLADIPAPDPSIVNAVDNCPGTIVIHVQDIDNGGTGCPSDPLVISRTYQATDQAGNFTQCNQTITVIDSTGPSVSCPADITLECGQSMTDPSVTGTITAGDNCTNSTSAGSLTAAYALATDAGNINVDYCGLVPCVGQDPWGSAILTGSGGSYSAAITLAQFWQIQEIDFKVAPVNDIMVGNGVPIVDNTWQNINGNGQNSLTTNFVAPVGACGGIAMRLTIGRQSFFGGLDPSSIRTVWVFDPNFSMSSNPTNTPLIAGFCLNGSTGPLVTYNDVFTAGCGNTGVIARTFTATDDCGNSTSCTQQITIEDNTAPTVTCPSDISVDTDPGQCGAVVNFAATAADGCGNATVSYSTAPGSFFNTGTTVVTVTATDDCGNTSTCDFNVNVSDNEAPNAVCQDVTVQLDGSGQGGITVSDVDGGSTDNCTIASITIDNGSFDCSNVGANTVAVTVTDNSGNSSTCTANVTVEDNVAPNAVCQDVTVQLDASGQGSIVASDVDGGSTDNCAVASISIDNGSFDCSNVGMASTSAWINEFHYDNASGDVGEFVEVAGDAGIDLNGWSIVLYNGSNGLSYNTINLSGVIANQSNGFGAISFSQAGIQNGSPDGIALIDANGTAVEFLSYEGSFTAVNGPAAGLLSTDVGVAEGGGTPAGFSLQRVGTGSSGSDFSFAAPQAETPGAVNTGQSFATSLGNTVTLTVTDVNGNSSSCTANVTVEDNVPPTAVCNDLTIGLDNDGEASIVAGDVDGGSFDNCAIASIAINNSEFDCANVGANTVTLTVTDVNGNVSTCTSTVTVEDNIAPNAVCQNVTVQLDNSGNASITAADVDGGSTDNCGIASINVSDTDFDCADVGATGGSSAWINEFHYDNAGTDTGEFVEVAGNAGLDLSGWNLVFYNGSNGSIYRTESLSGVIADQGNGFGTVVVNLPSNGIQNGSPDGIALVDGVGNVIEFLSYEGSFVATAGPANGLPSTDIIEDESSSTPVGFSLQRVGTGSSAADFTFAPEAAQTAGAFNTGQTFVPAAGGVVVTLTVTDVNGNMNSCDASVTVEDNVAPNAVCQDVTVQLDGNGQGSIVASDVDGGSTDNCAIASISIDNGSFDCSNVGGNTVTLTVTDVNGNSSTCTANVAVEDNVAPNAVCQDVTVQLDGNGQGSIVASDVDGGSTDNCAIASIGIDNGSFDCSNVGGNTVTLTVTDVNGNSSTCTANVAVEDNVAPNAVCQDITINIGSTGSVGISASDVDGGSTDNCAIQSLAVSPNTFDCANLGNNQVTLTVTDVNGNVSTCNANVTVTNDPLVISASSPTFACGFNISCNGETDGSIATVTTGGCEPYSYSWSNGSTMANPNGLGAGGYAVTVTDANGNTATTSITLTEPDLLVVSLSSPTFNGGWNISCNGNNDGSIDASTVGGCAAYSYAWTGPNGFTSTMEDPSMLFAGTYSVTVTDQNGCSASASITLTEPATLVAEAGPNVTVYVGYPPTECTTLNGFEAGGTMPYSVTWSEGSVGNVIATSNSVQVCPTSSTIYYYQVVDANGCYAIDSMIVCALDVTCTDRTNNGQNGTGQSGNGTNNGQGGGAGLTHISICHIPPGNPGNAMVKCIPLPAVASHLAHGDYLGACGTDTVQCTFDDILGNKQAQPAATESTEEHMHVDAFPNPTNGALKVELFKHSVNEGRYMVKVVDMMGQVLTQTEVELVAGRAVTEFDLGQYANGFYFIVVEGGEQRLTTKVMKN